MAVDTKPQTKAESLSSSTLLSDGCELRLYSGSNSTADGVVTLGTYTVSQCVDVLDQPKTVPGRTQHKWETIISK